MRLNSKGPTCILIILLILLSTEISYSQRTGYTKNEFMQRRAALMGQVDSGIIILFGDGDPLPGIRFRQDNDFFYFTGVEDFNSILLMVPSTKQTILFLPPQSDKEISRSGANYLSDSEAGKTDAGFEDIQPITMFNEWLARNLGKYKNIINMRLSPRDHVDTASDETARYQARRMNTVWNSYLTVDQFRVKLMKEIYTNVRLKDVSPLIREMRAIKSKEEIEIYKINGKVSALATKQAMEITKPGMYEYELEAVAEYILKKNGCQGSAFQAIVGSGPNVNLWHYDKNNRKMEEGDLVVMDYGGSLDYLCMDITRTWPVSGEFTREQRKVYVAVLEAQKEMIAASRPGITYEEVGEIGGEILKRHGYEGFLGFFPGHFVGLSSHDGLGIASGPMKPGHVFAIEPIVEFPDKQIHVRIEDTVLITEDGHIVLSQLVPKEIDEMEVIVGSK